MLLIKNRFVIFSAGVVTGLIIKSLLQQSESKECHFDPESPFLCGGTPCNPEQASESEPKSELESATDTSIDTENRLDDSSPKD